MFVLIYTDTDTPICEVTHAATARRKAKDVAKQSGREVGVRAGGRLWYRMLPAGTVSMPEGTLATLCTAGDGEGACFCHGCREERRRLA